MGAIGLKPSDEPKIAAGTPITIITAPSTASGMRCRNASTIPARQNDAATTGWGPTIDCEPPSDSGEPSIAPAVNPYAAIAPARARSANGCTRQVEGHVTRRNVQRRPAPRLARTADDGSSDR